MGAAPTPNQPPPYGCAIDWSHPLARGLQCFIHGATMTDMVHGYVFEPGTNSHNSISYQANEGGIGYKFVDGFGAGQQWGSVKLGGVWPNGLKETTWAWAGIYPDSSYIFNRLWHVADSAGTVLMYNIVAGGGANVELRSAYQNESGGLAGWGRFTDFKAANGDDIENERYTTWAGALDGRGWPYNGQVLNSKNFQDSTAGSGHPPTDSKPDRFYLGPDGNAEPGSHTLNCWAAWNRRLTNEELFAWTADPYQMFVPIIDLIDFETVAAADLAALLSHPHRHTNLGFA